MAAHETEDMSMNALSPDEDRQRENDMKLLKLMAVRVLACNWDSVQIVVTRHDGEHGTYSASHGEGNYYARVGSVRDWLREQRSEPG